MQINLLCVLVFFTTPLPNKQVIDLDVFFSVESIAYQDDELAPSLLILFKPSLLSGVIDLLF